MFYFFFHKSFLLISRDFLMMTYVRKRHAIQLINIVTGKTNVYDLIFPTGIRKLSVIGVLKNSVSIHWQNDADERSVKSEISELF
jgi:hypothetical protein